MLHTLSSVKKRKKRVGRGGARGKNSGGGHKGQRSRAGHRIRPAIRDEIQRIPKRRGHNKNRARTVRSGKVVRSVTLSMLNKNFESGSTITPKTLVDMNLLTNVRGKTPKVKVVATGELSHPISIKKCLVSEGAKVKIEKAGGSII